MSTQNGLHSMSEMKKEMLSIRWFLRVKKIYIKLKIVVKQSRKISQDMPRVWK